MEYVIPKIVVLVGLMTIGTTGQSRAVAAIAAPRPSLDHIGKSALRVCQNMSACISESTIAKHVLSYAKGDWGFITWISRTKPKLLKMQNDICNGVSSSLDTPATNETIRAIVAKVAPTIKKVLTEALNLNLNNIESFWACHGESITNELATALRTRLSAEHLEEIKGLLEQNHFIKFLDIIGNVLTQQIKTAPLNLNQKADLEELRDNIINAAIEKMQ